ncbi:MAG: chemotaxis protein CheW [Planctomycetota bacterium]|nr:chemotaxis protein CheW [Planctomycetota bacterium]
MSIQQPLDRLASTLASLSLDDESSPCIIVLEVEGVSDREVAQVGCVVDTVSEVLDITLEQVEPPPRFGTAISTEFILGLGKLKQKVIALIDIDRVLSHEEVVELTREVSVEAEARTA